MGCCCSGHEEAKLSELPPPMFGKDCHVMLKKQGWLDADFDVRDLDSPDEDGKPQQWLLIDAVGSIGDSYFDYYLKYRAPGMKESLILGCANMKKDFDYMWFNVLSSRVDHGSHPDGYNRRNIRWVDKAISAKWIISRRARLFGPAGVLPDGAEKTAENLQKDIIGRLQIAGTGTYWRHRHEEEWEELEHYTVTVGEGENAHEEQRTRWVHRSSVDDNYETDLQDFNYKMNAYLSDYAIQYDKESSGSWFASDKLIFQATNMSGMPLFRATSNGKSECELHTYSNSDPVNALLAAFAISIKMEPKEFYSICKGYCYDNIQLGMPTWHYGGFGPPDDEFERMFPTGPEVVMPQMGFAYGVVTAELPMAMPVLQGQPFVPTATPVGFNAALPMAQPLYTPTIGVAPTADPIPMAIPMAEPWNAKGNTLAYPATLTA
uniref:Uncharacterized protein n=1 Tax=Haptolina brevifila TaxID=156173 RepID=A0A7S2G824_9EUKA|mmetsp:Transcript_29053/g.58568  ORF Transcript_29053/g.58568 Transcript_29053/m.58568 type:complete len:434 (+) Transcript_29053:3-1304(+)